MSASSNNMPARIWAGGDIPNRRWSESEPLHRDDPINTLYIRADIVERLVEALSGLERGLMKDSRDKTVTADTVEYHLDGQVMYQAINGVRTALAAYRDSINDKA